MTLQAVCQRQSLTGQTGGGMTLYELVYATTSQFGFLIFLGMTGVGSTRLYELV